MDLIDKVISPNNRSEIHLHHQIQSAIASSEDSSISVALSIAFNFEDVTGRSFTKEFIHNLVSHI